MYYKLNTKYKDRLFRLIFHEKKELLEPAVDECIRNNILAEILRKNRGEIVDSILTEWDEDEYREFLKEESWKEGHETGKKMELRLEKSEERLPERLLGRLKYTRNFNFQKKTH